MREIKFRAWDKVEKHMRWLTDILKLGTSETDRHVLMQYTGLKDNNDKEIYEGDIIRPLIINGTITDGIILFKHGRFVVEQIGAERMNECLGLINTKNMEIVGNIYKNPDLLKR